MERAFWIVPEQIDEEKLACIASSISIGKNYFTGLKTSIYNKDWLSVLRFRIGKEGPVLTLKEVLKRYGLPLLLLLYRQMPDYLQASGKIMARLSCLKKPRQVELETGRIIFNYQTASQFRDALFKAARIEMTDKTKAKGQRFVMLFSYWSLTIKFFESAAGKEAPLPSIFLKGDYEIWLFLMLKELHSDGALSENHPGWIKDLLLDDQGPQSNKVKKVIAELYNIIKQQFQLYQRETTWLDGCEWLTDLFIKSFHNRLTTQERGILLSWRDQSVEAKKLYEKLHDASFLEAQIMLFIAPLVSTMNKSLVKKVPFRPTFRH
jgi:hypothetical protein